MCYTNAVMSFLPSDFAKFAIFDTPKTQSELDNNYNNNVQA